MFLGSSVAVHMPLHIKWIKRNITHQFSSYLICSYIAILNTYVTGYKQVKKKKATSEVRYPLQSQIYV